jgi:hypothetical protein
MTIPLNITWNLISFNLSPAQDSAALAFGVPPSTGFLAVKDNAGNLYCPTLGQDDIHYITVGQGYQAYTSLPDTFTLSGTPVTIAATPIALSTGWNTIGYLPQADDSIEHAIAGIAASTILAKDNTGHIYWPGLAIDNIGIMQVGAGYKVLMAAKTSLTYPTPLALSKSITAASHAPLLRLPDPRHYAVHAITGNNATLLAKRVTMGGTIAPDSSEIGAFDGSGSLVGSGTVIRGLASFALWGSDPFAKQSRGAAANAPISFRLWNGSQEYPLDFSSADGSQPRYATDAVYIGALAVSPGALVNQFGLAGAYPNPFRGSVHIAFDVPSINGLAEQKLSLEVYDLAGRLVERLAQGAYKPGHYTIAWNAAGEREAVDGSNTYVVRLRAEGFDREMKVVRLRD